MMPSRYRSNVLDLFVGIGILFLDQITKYFSVQYFSIGACRFIGSLGPIELFFTLTTNQGAAWGFFNEFPRALLCFRLFFVLLLFGVYAISKKSMSIRTALAVILAGACSNIVDTLYYGQVIDMIHFRFWGWNYPIFNMADVSICMAAAYVVFYSLFLKDIEDR
jgi:signal peptidase II